jgi:hypothetical protein
MAKVFKTLRWLRPYQSKNGHQVFIRVRLKNHTDINIPVHDFFKKERVPISVKKENWNKGYITGGNYHISVRELNSLLTRVEHNVKDAVEELIEKNIIINQENIFKLTYINELTADENERKIASGEIIVDEDGGAFASEREFKDFIRKTDDPRYEKLKKSMGYYKRDYILDYWDDFIKNYAPESYNSPRKAIKDYIDSTGDNCKAKEFSAEWQERFFKWIVNNGWSFREDGTNRKNYTITTVSKYQKHLRRFGKYLFEDIKLLETEDYKRFVLRKDGKKQSIIKYKSEVFINTQALYKKEFDWFYAFKFEDKQLELVRDMFVMQVWLGGLRQRDFYKLSKQNFHKDSTGIKVWFKQKKTGDDVMNTVNLNYLNPILEKYPNIFKEFPKVAIYNKKLKEAATLAGLNRTLKFSTEDVTKKEAVEEWIEIHKTISNNWARNCAVSILCELGYPDYRIAKFTGHKDLEMINHYKNIHKKDLQSMLDEVKPEIVTEL